MTALFLCAGNTCRSPMAAALFEKYLKDIAEDGIIAESAGLNAEGKTSPYAVAALMERGIRLTPRDAIQVDADMLNAADIVFAMTDAQAAALRELCADSGKLHSLSELAGKDISDPFSMGLAKYRECCLELAALMPKIYEFIKKRG